MHGADFGATDWTTAEAGKTRGCSTPELGVEGVEDPDVVLRIGKDVDIHHFEHVEREDDVGLEAEGEGMGDLCGVGGEWMGVVVAPDEF